MGFDQENTGVGRTVSQRSAVCLGEVCSVSRMGEISRKCLSRVHTLENKEIISWCR